MTTFKHKMDRQSTVMALSIKGLRIEEIARQLRIGHRTADRDLAQMRARVKDEILSKSPEEILLDLQMARKFRVRAICNIIGDFKPTAVEKFHAIELLRKEDEWHLKQMQTFGLVPKESKKMTVNVIGRNVQVNRIEELNVNRKVLAVKTV